MGSIGAWLTGKMKTDFKLNLYPEIKKSYSKLVKLRNKLLSASLKNGENATKLREEINALERGEISELIFKTFCKKVKFVFHEVEGKKEWDKVFGQDFAKLTDGQKEELTGLIDGDFIYRLPREFYNDNPYFEGYYD